MRRGETGFVITAIVALGLLDATGAVAANWGDFKKDHCVSSSHRQYSSRLWNIQGSWEAACAAMPADVRDEHGQVHHFSRPTRCNNTGLGGMWGEFDVPDRTCGPHWGDFKKDHCVGLGTRQYSSRLWNIAGDWEAACRATPATVAGRHFASPTRCVNTGLGGMWGEFDIRDDADCPRWEEMALKWDCTVWQQKTYTARLADVPPGFTPRQACGERTAQVSGAAMSPTRCIDDNGMWGEWDVAAPSCPRTGTGAGPLPSGCYTLNSFSTHRYLAHNKQGFLSESEINLSGVRAFSANRTEAREWEKFQLIRTFSNRYYVWSEEQRFLSDLWLRGIYNDREPGPWAEWEIDRVTPAAWPSHPQAEGVFVLRHTRTRTSLHAPADKDMFASSTAPGAAPADVWMIARATGCRELPVEDDGSIHSDAVVSPSSGPITGMADLHLHLFNNLGFGEQGVHGSPYSSLGLRGALPWCTASHGAGGILDLNGGFVNNGGPPGHLVGGYPQFDGWPNHHNANHQFAYHKWLERAYVGGLRLIVSMAGNNETLCGVANLVNKGAQAYSCADMPALDRQIEATKALEAYIDERAGGPGQGWFRIAYSPAEARSIIDSGRMAVILGAEMDTLFDCGVTGCDFNGVMAQLDAYYRRGLRYVFPIGHIDNGFGGCALYNALFNMANRFKNGEFFKVVDCETGANRPGFGFNANLLDPDKADFLNKLGKVVGLTNVVPSYPVMPGGHCNALGLTPLGARFIEALIAKGMIIDVDHMSARATDAVFAIAEKHNYPLVGGHSGFADMAPKPVKSEALKTKSDLARIKSLGGLVAPFLPSGTTREAMVEAGLAPMTGSPEHCYATSRGFATAYKYARTQMGGDASAVPFGSDFNGWVHQASPRFSTEARWACPGEARPIAYPFTSHLGNGSFRQLQAGDRTFDFNKDGMANVGLLPDFVQDLKNIGLSDDDLEPLFRGAEGLIQAWEKMVDPAKRIGGPPPAPAPSAGYDRPAGNLPWSAARERCRTQGQRLCVRGEVCPGGPGTEPRLGRPDGDVWMAVGDHPNAWISIGTSYDERLCRFHEDLGGPPFWGETTGPEAVTGTPAAMMCCGYERVSPALPWSAASQRCESRGERLCRRAEICPGGPGSEPRLGRPDGDVWMAVGDHANAWISIGTAFDERLCRLHEDLGGPPSWGQTTGPEAVTNVPAAMMCCG